MGRPAADDPALFQAAAAAAARSRPRDVSEERGVADRLERLVNLTATLLDTRRPLTLDELVRPRRAALPRGARVAPPAFERDKETLRELGIPIRVETADGFGSEQAYRIHPDDYYLPELELTEDELAALHVAVTAVRLEGDAGREGLAKLGGLDGRGRRQPVRPARRDPGRSRCCSTR